MWLAPCEKCGKANIVPMPDRATVDSPHIMRRLRDRWRRAHPPLRHICVDRSSGRTWTRTRITPELGDDRGGRKVRFLLGERSDGGVFFVEMRESYPEDAARLQLDEYLAAPLNPASIGTFDHNFYVPEISPRRLG